MVLFSSYFEVFFTLNPFWLPYFLAYFCGGLTATTPQHEKRRQEMSHLLILCDPKAGGKMVDSDNNPKDKIRALIGTSQNDPDANTRQQAAIDLESFSRDREVLKVIITIALNDPDPNTRQQALKILDKLPSCCSLPQIVVNWWVMKPS